MPRFNWYRRYCRWCNVALRSDRASQFCCPAHKQAHYRAYKKYVTGLLAIREAGSTSKKGTAKPSNARKKRKER